MKKTIAWLTAIGVMATVPVWAAVSAPKAKTAHKPMNVKITKPAPKTVKPAAKPIIKSVKKTTAVKPVQKTAKPMKSIKPVVKGKSSVKPVTKKVSSPVKPALKKK